MFATISRSWEVMKQSWRVLAQDKSLAIFPVLSTIFSILALALVFGPFIPSWTEAGAEPSSALMFGLGCVALYLTTFLTIFFNVALVSCAQRSFAGEDTKVGEGISAAMTRLPQIASWAFVAFLVGMLLRALDALADELPFPLSLVANIGVWLVGGLWSVMTYLVVPVVAFEGVGGWEAVKKSKTYVTARWGDAIVGNVGIGIVCFLLGMLPAGILMAVGASMGGSAGIALAGLGVLLLVASAVISSTLTQVYNTALYGYVTGGAVPTAFDQHTLSAAFGPKKS